MHPDLQRHIDKYYGKYGGVVTDVADPLQQGRIKVQIPAIVKDDELWARPCFPPGHFFVPAVASRVWIEFEAGDIRSPLWVGVWYPVADVPSLAQEQGADASVIETPAGHRLEISDKEGKEQIHVTHAKGKWQVTISEEGDVTIDIAGDSQQQIRGKLNIEVKGAVEITAQDGVTIHDASSILLGRNAQDHVMLFEKFQQWWESQFKTVWQTHTHNVGPVVSGPPNSPLPSPTQALTAAKVTKAQ